jgi:hypothetical protein
MPTITTCTRPCGCVVELETDRKGKTPEFLMLSRVCQVHKPLASLEKKPNHSELSLHVMELIEEAKVDNLADYEAAISRCEFEYERQEVRSQLSIVLNKSKWLDEVFYERLSKPHAFDKHIHEQILIELTQN